MGSLNNSIKMLCMLRVDKFIRRKDIAERLEVSEKQVSRYKLALDEIAEIESTPGVNGGYKLIKKVALFDYILSKDEFKKLKLALNAVEENLNIDSSELSIILDKLKQHIGGTVSESTIISQGKIKESEDMLEKRIKIEEAINESKQIIITYVGNDSVESRREIQPYKIFYYKSEAYVSTYCLLKHDIRDFKLIRIKEYILTSKIFEKNIEHELKINKSIENYRNNRIGIFNDSSNEYNMKLEVSPPMSNYVKERQWVKDQIIEEIGGGKILFMAKMKADPETISWILSLREYSKILEPIELKNDINIVLNKMIKNIDYLQD